jgi:uncharacterized protein with HEPN domain
MVLQQVIFLFIGVFCTGAVRKNSGSNLPVTEQLFRDVLDGIIREMVKSTGTVKTVRALRLYAHKGQKNFVESIVDFTNLLDPDQLDVFETHQKLFTKQLLDDFGVRVQALLDENETPDTIETMKDLEESLAAQIHDLEDVTRETVSATANLNDFIQQVEKSEDFSQDSQTHLIVRAQNLFQNFISEVKAIGEDLAAIKKINYAIDNIHSEIPSMSYQNLLISANHINQGMAGYSHLLSANVNDDQLVKDFDALIRRDSHEITAALESSFGPLERSIESALEQKSQEIVDRFQNFIDSQKRQKSPILARFYGMKMLSAVEAVQQIKRFNSGHAELFSLMLFGVENGDKIVINAVNDVWADLIGQKKPQVMGRPPKVLLSRLLQEH